MIIVLQALVNHSISLFWFIFYIFFSFSFLHIIYQSLVMWVDSKDNPLFCGPFIYSDDCFFCYVETFILTWFNLIGKLLIQFSCTSNKLFRKLSSMLPSLRVLPKLFTNSCWILRWFLSSMRDKERIPLFNMWFSSEQLLTVGSFHFFLF